MKMTKKVTKKLIRDVNSKAVLTVGAVMDMTHMELVHFVTNRDIHRYLGMGYTNQTLLEAMQSIARESGLDRTDDFFDVSGFLDYIEFLRGE